MDASSVGDISLSQREPVSHPSNDYDVINDDLAGDNVDEGPSSPIRTPPAAPPAFKVRPGASLTTQTKQRNFTLPLLLAGGALTVLAALLGALQKRRRVVRRADVRLEALFSTVVHLPPPQKLADVPLLTGRSFVVSDWCVGCRAAALEQPTWPLRAIPTTPSSRLDLCPAAAWTSRQSRGGLEARPGDGAAHRRSTAAPWWTRWLPMAPAAARWCAASLWAWARC